VLLHNRIVLIRLSDNLIRLFMETLHMQHDIPDNTPEKIDSLVLGIENLLKQYKTKLKDNSFREGEQEQMQKRISTLVAKAERIKNGEIVSESESIISTPFSHTTPEGQTHTEQIHLDIEQEIQEYTQFYQEKGIDLPSDFEESIQEIWNTNYDTIQSAIEEYGFNKILIAPASIPLPELTQKMSMESGYYLGDNFKNAGSFDTVQSTNTDKPRIILYHAKSLPDIQTQNGIDPHLSITAGDAQTLYDTNPDQYLSTLEDAILLEAKHLKDTQTHISDYNTKSATWLPASKQTGSSRFFCSFWYPDLSELDVSALDADHSDSLLGLRPSRYFY